MKKILLVLLLVMVLSGCRESEVANYNMRRDADYFNIYRRVTAINTWTGEALFCVEGYISLGTDTDGDLNVLIKTGEDEYKLFYAHLSENVTYTCEQSDSEHVSGYAYEITWFPTIKQLQHGLYDWVDRDGENIYGE